MPVEVSEDIQRELVYGLNALLLRSHPQVPSAATFTEALVGVMQREGPRFHEPDLVGAWARDAGTERDELVEELEEAVGTILDELEDDEEPWSAHRVLDLLAEERFWTLHWGGSGGSVPAAPRRSTGLALPLTLRPALVAVLNQLELTLFEANQDQRSVHDRLDPRIVDQALDAAIDGFAKVGRSHQRKGAPRDLPEALVRTGPQLPGLREALAVVQRWKLSVEFDAAPDDDDGEWTLRVLERLYGLEWVAPVA